MVAEARYGLKTHGHEEDDVVDRLNSRITVMALAMCIFILTAKTYVGDPINCWTPAQFTGTHNAYTNSICWLKGTYYLPSDEITVPDRSKPRTYHVSYYQWTPYILVIMSVLFLLPKFLWHAYTLRAGLNLRRLVNSLKGNVENEKGIELVQKKLEAHLDAPRRLRGKTGVKQRYYYTRLSIVYFVIKLWYLTNSLGQFFLLNAFLAFPFSGYGFEAMRKFFRYDDDWFESPRFPRITMCDFMIRHLGSNQHWYAIQCNLPINLFNEKIFLGMESFEYHVTSSGMLRTR
ncbi:unnamed protein product [Didymodactylos carnosus]|uniref:Innexin n=1 Tax=Didymodactylos carnosus TaxID=1234261 RepID=A0A8S2GMC6_9BILA|nr:unnamed protein product [Didymodactylos carnosus]CAF3534882.1 unnamed protein product [Didymodactylos carnosus]